MNEILTDNGETCKLLLVIVTSECSDMSAY